MTQNKTVFFDAGLFIAALLSGDTRHAEAKPLVEAARNGELQGCTTTGILSEVYAALTWVKANPPHLPSEAAKAVRLLVEPPSEILVLQTGLDAAIKMLELAEKFKLTARRVHDARHAAIAMVSGVTSVYTYDVNDWVVFKKDGLHITGPASIIDKVLTEKNEKK